MEPAFLVKPRELCYLGEGMQAKKTSSSKKRRPSQPLTLIHQGLGTEMLQAIAELGNDGIFVFNEDYRIAYANRMVSEITEYSNEELLKMTILSLLGRPNQPLIEDIFTHPERYGEKNCMQIQLLTSKEMAKEVEICIALAQTPLGVRKGYAYLRDVTASKRMERKIREGAQEFEKIAEMGEDGIVVFDQAFKIIFANQVASEITGIPREDLI